MSEAGVILQLTGMRPTKLGAFELYLIELARRCRREGYRTVLQYERLPENPLLQNAFREAGIEIAACASLAGPILSVFRVGALIRRLRPRIVHTHFLNGYAQLAVPTIARWSGARRCVVTNHSGLSGRRTDWHLRWGLGRYDRVLCVSEAIRRELILIGVPSAIVTTHYLGVFADGARTTAERGAIRRRLGLSGSAIVVASIARDGPEKGLDVLLEALVLLVSRHRHLEIVIFGVDPRASQLPAMAAARGLEGRIHWLGVRSDASRLLAAADLYVQPSRSEGLGLAIIEAMAAGLPVLASDVGGIPEAVADGVTGYLVPPGNPQLLAAAIDRLLTDPALARAFGEAGRRRYEAQFRGADSIERMMEVYFQPRDHQGREVPERPSRVV